jgi:hypothetical protein
VAAKTGRFTYRSVDVRITGRLSRRSGTLGGTISVVTPLDRCTANVSFDAKRGR